MRGTLSRDVILEAALRIVDGEGLEALSMRRLGSELGVEAASLYRHFPGKDALLDGMVEVLLTGMRVPPAEDASWEERAREMCRSYRRLAREHPNAFPLFATRPSNTAGALRIVDLFLGVFRESGFGPEASLHALRTLQGYTLGYALSELRGFVLGGRGGAPILEELSPRELRKFPNIAELAPRLDGMDLDDEFETGLALVVAGLRWYLDHP